MDKLFQTLLAFIFVSVLLLAACGTGGTSANLEGTTWKLVSYGQVSNPTPALSDVNAVMSFEKAGRVGGNVGCNSFGGEYKVSGSRISFSSMVSTMMACEGPRMQQEEAVLKVLGENASFNLDSGKLAITSSDGTQVLNFIQAGN